MWKQQLVMCRSGVYCLFTVHYVTLDVRLRLPERSRTGLLVLRCRNYIALE